MGTKTLRGIEAMADRMLRGKSEFITNLMTIGDIDQPAAERVYAAFCRAKAIKCDFGVERVSVKHGALLDREVVRRMAGVSA